MVEQGRYDSADNVFGILFQIGDSLLYWLVQVSEAGYAPHGSEARALALPKP